MNSPDTILIYRNVPTFTANTIKVRQCVTVPEPISADPPKNSVKMTISIRYKTSRNFVAGTPVQSVEVRSGDISGAAVTECRVMPRPEVTEQFILVEEAGMARR